jgi:hypothetical protein
MSTEEIKKEEADEIKKEEAEEIKKEEADEIKKEEVDEITKFIEDKPFIERYKFKLTLFKNYCISLFEILKKLCMCGIKKDVQVNNLFIYTFMYKNRLVRMPIKPSPYNSSNIVKIKYMKKDIYEEDEETIEYIKSFLETKIENVTICPKYLGFEKLLITVFDDSFEQVDKEFNTNDIISL